MKMGLTQFYHDKATALASRIIVLKGQGHLFMTGEIAFFLLAIGFVVLFTLMDGASWTLLLAVLSMGAYIAIRHFDVRNSEKIESLERLRLVYDHELRGLQGDFSGFDKGDPYKDEHHPFSFDLDIFGQESLFHRINRTVTTGGSDALADYLSFRKVKDQSVEIQQLSEDEPWRAEFMSLGKGRVIDSTAILRVVEAVSTLPVSRQYASPVLCALAWLLILGFLSSVVGAACGKVSAQLPIWWGVLQFFFVYGVTAKALRQVSKVVGAIHGQLMNEIAVIRHCTRLREVPASLCPSISALKESVVSFEQLEKVLQGLDRRGNILGLFLFDAFFLSDFFLVRKFLKWQDMYLDKMRSWADQVSEIDALVSMATFRFNHPEACTAEIVEADAVVYEAKNIYHPFLGAKAVKNDFTVQDGNYYIITGANMAGKSTFLRTLGINYVLGMNGMPVFADSLRISRFALFSSMRTTDDLTHGISYFNAELLRLQQLMAFCQCHPHTLIILDEILKGTNSLDKLNGSRLFLQTIQKLPVSGIIATHDLELSKMADEYPATFHNYCFEIELGTDVTYSYRITPGVARNQNATFLLNNILKTLHTS